MNSTVIQQYETLTRIRDFEATRASDFPAASLGGQLFATVILSVGQFAEMAALQTASGRGALVGAATRKKLRDNLRGRLKDLNRTVRIITASNPTLRKKFKLPDGGDQRLLAAARAFVKEAEPLKAEFIKPEWPADFLEKFKSEIDEFEGALTQQNQSTGSRIKATAALKAILAPGLEAVPHLDVIVKNKYRDDIPTLMEWDSARRLEHKKGRSRSSAKADPTKPNPSAAPSAG